MTFNTVKLNILLVRIFLLPLFSRKSVKIPVIL